MLELRGITKRFFPHTNNERVALNRLNLTLRTGDFVTIIGSNGAGKSTLLNVIGGRFLADEGEVIINDQNVSRMPEHRRARWVSRVFQDPMAGTSPQLTIQENLAIAFQRGQRRGLRMAVNRSRQEVYRQALSTLELGLENRLDMRVGMLSGGQRQALSLLMFTGGSQFAFIGVIAGSGTAPAAVTAATLLGLRNGIYGMQMNALLHPRGWRRILGAHVTIDESAAVAMGQQSPTEAARGFWAAGLGVFALWNAFTLVGALAGNAIGDPRQWGLDGAAVAAFVGLLWPRLRNREPVIIAVICALVTALFIPLLPPGIPILIAATVAAGLSFVARGPAHEGLEPDFPIDYDQGDRR